MPMTHYAYLQPDQGDRAWWTVCWADWTGMVGFGQGWEGEQDLDRQDRDVVQAGLLWASEAALHAPSCGW